MLTNEPPLGAPPWPALLWAAGSTVCWPVGALYVSPRVEKRGSVSGFSPAEMCGG